MVETGSRVLRGTWVLVQQLPEEAIDMRIALAANSGFEIEFEIRILPTSVSRMCG